MNIGAFGHDQNSFELVIGGSYHMQFFLGMPLEILYGEIKSFQDSAGTAQPQIVFSVGVVTRILQYGGESAY